MEHETEYEELQREWNENIDSVFGLMDKLEASEKLKELEAADVFTKAIAKRRTRLAELDLLIHEKKGLGKFVSGKSVSFDKGQ